VGSFLEKGWPRVRKYAVRRTIQRRKRGGMSFILCGEKEGRVIRETQVINESGEKAEKGKRGVFFRLMEGEAM